MLPPHPPAASANYPPPAPSSNCWNAGRCEDPAHACFVKLKTSEAGRAYCRATCPAGWLCETRANSSCGPAPLPAKLKPASADLRALLANALGVRLCNRLAPPQGALSFEMTCYDGGQTGNRWIMVSNLLSRAACCGGVALLPPEFDHFPASGAACFDFSGLRKVTHLKGRGALPLAPVAHHSCAANVSTSSKRWWGSPMERETLASCASSVGIRSLVRLVASTYAGFAQPGSVFDGRPCPAEGPPTLAMHIRSGEIFTNWIDGKHVRVHAGFQHDPFTRGQPPLSFYLAAMAHYRTAVRRWAHARNTSDGSGGTDGAQGSADLVGAEPRAMVVTAPDQANPVVGPLLTSPNLSMPVALSSSESFAADLSQLLCARGLVLSSSSLNPMLLAQPNLRDVYFFSLGACRVGARCEDERLGLALPRRYWCIAGDGPYSVDQSWRNDAQQRSEMLTYRVHDPIEVNVTPWGCAR